MAEAAFAAGRAKFSDPDITANGEPRAQVPLTSLRTLWINTGSLCNITCRNCYIESSPENDRLAYITSAEVGTYLNEIARRQQRRPPPQYSALLILSRAMAVQAQRAALAFYSVL